MAKKRGLLYSKIANDQYGKQRVMTFLTYGAIIAISILASVYEPIFDRDNFDPNRFVMKLSISLAIGIFSMLLALRDGRTTNETKKNGEYFDAKKTFGEKLKLLVNKEWFKQWCDNVLYVRERKSAIEGIIQEYNVTEYEYMYVSDEDLKTLRREPKSCTYVKPGTEVEETKPLDVIDDAQYAVLRYVRSGRFRFKRLEYTYFTSRNSRNGYAYQANLQENQRKRKVFAIFFRCFIILVTTGITALAIINPNKESAQQVAFDTVGRIVTLLSSVFMGYALANDDMVENIDAIEFKCDKIDEYFAERESGAFVPVSKDEVVKAKIEQMERKRREEAEKAAASVVDPTVVAPAPPAIEYREVEMTVEELEKYRKDHPENVG